MPQTSLLPAAYDQCCRIHSWSGQLQVEFSLHCSDCHLRNWSFCGHVCQNGRGIMTELLEGAVVCYIPWAWDTTLLDGFFILLAKLDKNLWTVWSRFLLQWGAVQVMHLAELIGPVTLSTALHWCSHAGWFSCRSAAWISSHTNVSLTPCPHC